MSLRSSMNQAESKARQRDAKNKEVLSSEEIQQATGLQQKAAERGMKLVPERRVKNRAKFVQLIQENILFLRREKFLTTAEKAFLVDICVYVGFLSNCIVDDITAKNPIPMTQSDLAAELGMDRSNMSKRINKLIDKGIIARSESALEHNNVRTYALYVNPHFMFSGNRDDINKTLETMFIKAMKNPTLKKLPSRFF